MGSDDGRVRKRLGYVPALDGLRGVAIAAVVLYHAFHVPSGGFFGVDLFFVLSGFLITSLLLDEHARTGRIRLRAFFGRRARRLLPALLLFLLSMLAIVAICHKIGFPAIASGVIGGAYLMNLFAAADSLPPIAGWIVHLWSLAEEEQFYLLWPTLLMFALWRRWRIDIVLAVMLVLFIGRMVEVGASSAGFDRVYYAPDTHAIPIVVGCLLAARPLAVRGASALASAAMFFTAVFLATPTKDSFLIWELVAVAGAAGLVSYASTQTATWLRSGPLVWLGLISYSAYLWHPVLIGFLRGTTWLGVLATLAVASLSYRFIETPFRRRRARRIDQLLLEVRGERSAAELHLDAHASA